jgi:hypothetical protein
MGRACRVVAAVLAVAPLSCIEIVGLGGYTVEDDPPLVDSGSGGTIAADAAVIDGPVEATGALADGSAPETLPASCGAGAPEKCTVDCGSGASCPSGLWCVAGACISPRGCSPEAGLVCTPFGQCGCRADQSCVQDLYGTSTAGRCITPGPGGQGSPCDLDGKCRIGLACYEGICSAYCAASTDCGAEGTCALLGRENVCFHLCDPFSQSAPCGSGAKCALPTDVAVGTVCMRAGVATQGESCSVDPTACAPGTTCLGDGVCRKLCRIGASDCAGSCDVVAGTAYGVCTAG